MADRPEPVRDLDWSPERARSFGDSVVALWEEFLRRLPEMDVDSGLREAAVRAAVVREPSPDPMSDDDLLEYLRTVIFENSMYPGHPGFLAYVSGPGTVPGAAADLIAGFLNQNLGGWRLSPAGTEIELALMRWLAGRFGFPDEAGGLVLSGGAMANFVCLKVARDNIVGHEVRAKGVSAYPALIFYCSEEAHVVISRAADMLGIGTDQVRKVPVDMAYRMLTDELTRMIEADRAAGYCPAVIAGTAGTTATGAIDPLRELAEIARANDMWFHVDGAYGGPAVLVDELRPLFAGIEEADSIAVDPHKWLYTPHSGGCAIVREMSQLARSFAAAAGYIHEDKEFTQRGIDLGQLGPQFSRGFHALKVWVSLLSHGTDAYARRIGQDVALARYLEQKVTEHPELELALSSSLSICCFRYVPADIPEGRDDAYLNALNERLMPIVQTQGKVYYSNAVLGGNFYQRVCIVNFRTEADDIDAVVDITVERGRRLHEEMRSSS